MKKLVVVTYQEQTGQQYVETIRALFGRSIEVSFQSMFEELPKGMDPDLVLASTYTYVKC